MIVTESNTELKKICQRPDSFHRYISLPITRFFLTYTSMSPTQVTVLDFFIGLIGGMLLFIGKDWSFVAGTILLQFFEVFDCVDGEVARYLMFKGKLKRTESETRVVEFLQDVVHPILQPLMYLGFCYGLYINYQQPILLIMGFIAAIGTSVDTHINILREKLIGSTNAKDASSLKKASRVYKEMKANAESMMKKIPFGKALVEIVTFITPIPGVIAMLNIFTILDLLFFPNMKVIDINGFPINFKVTVLFFYAFLQQALWFMNARQSIIHLQKE